MGKKIEHLDREVFICDCHSIEHQYAFWYDEDDNELWFEPHLVVYPWYKRLWGGIKYIFGYTTRYGNWDSMIINHDDIIKISQYLDKVKEVEMERVAIRGRD